MPQNYTIAKVTAVVNALAKLHNFCIDQKDAEAAPESVDEVLNAQDLSNIMSSEGGMIDMTPVNNHLGKRLFSTPRSLMVSGDHFNDMPDHPRANEDSGPRVVLHDRVVLSGKVRPTLRGTLLPTRKTKNTYKK
jgi:hypothetical protein